MSSFHNAITSDDTDFAILDQLINDVTNKIIPQTIPDMVRSTRSCDHRNKFIRAAGFAMVAKDWVSKLVKYILSEDTLEEFTDPGNNNTILEVMCGTGMLTKALRDEGLPVIAVDDGSWVKGKAHSFETTWIDDIIEMDACEAIKKYKPQYLIMAWPNYSKDTAYKILCTMRDEVPHCEMIYIGEDEGGCTADDDFFENFMELDGDEEFNEIAQMYQRGTWFGIHDQLKLGKHKD